MAKRSKSPKKDWRSLAMWFADPSHKSAILAVSKEVSLSPVAKTNLLKLLWAEVDAFTKGADEGAVFSNLKEAAKQRGVSLEAPTAAKAFTMPPKAKAKAKSTGKVKTAKKAADPPTKGGGESRRVDGGLRKMVEKTLPKKGRPKAKGKAAKGKAADKGKIIPMPKIKVGKGKTLAVLHAAEFPLSQAPASPSTQIAVEGAPRRGDLRGALLDRRIRPGREIVPYKAPPAPPASPKVKAPGPPKGSKFGKLAFAAGLGGLLVGAFGKGKPESGPTADLFGQSVKEQLVQQRAMENMQRNDPTVHQALLNFIGGVSPQTRQLSPGEVTIGGMSPNASQDEIDPRMLSMFLEQLG